MPQQILPVQTHHKKMWISRWLTADTDTGTIIRGISKLQIDFRDSSHSCHLVAWLVLRGSSQSVPGGTTSRRRIVPLIPIGDIKPNGSNIILIVDKRPLRVAGFSLSFKRNMS